MRGTPYLHSTKPPRFEWDGSWCRRSASAEPGPDACLRSGMAAFTCTGSSASQPARAPSNRRAARRHHRTRRMAPGRSRLIQSSLASPPRAEHVPGTSTRRRSSQAPSIPRGRQGRCSSTGASPAPRRAASEPQTSHVPSLFPSLPTCDDTETSRRSDQLCSTKLMGALGSRSPISATASPTSSQSITSMSFAKRPLMKMSNASRSTATSKSL